MTDQLITNNDDNYLSIVIPFFNEEDNIDMMIDTLLNCLEPLKVKFEIIMVDDGSSDGTWASIKKISNDNSNIIGVRLARNFGHQHALLAGLSMATGKAIVSMDGDLQHPPQLIEQMYNLHKEGYLVVNTLRKDAKVSSFFKRYTSYAFYKIFSFLTDVTMAPGSSDFRLIDRVVLKQLLQLDDVDLFLRGAVEWLGFSSVTISYEVGKRYSGSSKFSIGKMIKFAKGSIISFSTKPLIIGIWIGIITSFLAFLEILYVFHQWMAGKSVAGWASIIGIVSFLFGILFIILGIIGAYLARIHVALQKRPRFIISDVAK